MSSFDPFSRVIEALTATGPNPGGPAIVVEVEVADDGAVQTLVAGESYYLPSVGVGSESDDDVVAYRWRGRFDNDEVNRLHAEGFRHPFRDVDWRAQLDRHSLGWVCARRQDHLVGFLNVAWDGDAHAFVLDTVVASSARHAGVGTELMSVATQQARAAGCEWLHVDFEEHLRGFYLDACRFEPTPARLIRLQISA